jgi:hypothetical protein
MPLPLVNPSRLTCSFDVVSRCGLRRTPKVRQDIRGDCFGHLPRCLGTGGIFQKVQALRTGVARAPGNGRFRPASPREVLLTVCDQRPRRSDTGMFRGGVADAQGWSPLQPYRPGNGLATDGLGPAHEFGRDVAASGSARTLRDDLPACSACVSLRWNLKAQEYPFEVSLEV